MVDPGSVEAFKFDKVYGLTKKEVPMHFVLAINF